MLLFMLVNLILIPLSVFNLFTSLFSFRRDKVHPKPKYRPKVTLIVRTWDDDHIVSRFIDGALNQDYPKEKLQIIIADDASDDDTEKICKGYGDKITYVRAEKHHEKKAVFLNEVIKKHAKGEILVNTDIDAVFPKYWIRNLVEHFADEKIHAVCGPAYTGNYDMNWITRIRTIEDFWLFSSGMWGRYNMIGTAGTYGSNHAIRMETLEKLGYYGTKTLTEDAELAAELWGHSLKISMCPDAYVLVESVDDMASFIRERKRWIIGTLETGAKHSYWNRDHNLGSLSIVINFLAGPITIFSAIMMFFDWRFIIPILVNIFSIALNLIAFRARPMLLLWIPLFLFVHPVINGWATILTLKDKFFKEGVRWTKVSGGKYHRGFELNPPIKV
jgi:cellulose synthase/poly-beta-1,6-N-acetylglucosamine synthase-like glycosyltransferase